MCIHNIRLLINLKHQMTIIKKPDLTVVIVTYNSEKFIDRCLNSIRNHQIIIVDNNSSDNTIKIAEKHNPKMIINKKNYGYARAANIGIDNSHGDYILLINPDIYLQEDSIDNIILFMRQNKKCDVQGPQLMNDDGELIYSCKRFPTLKSAAGRRLGIFKDAVNRHLMYDYDHNEPRIVDWISGGCMLFKNRFKFDERYFLYLEDVDFCREKQVYYNPNATAIHSVQRDSTRKLKHFFFHARSFVKYKLKHF